MPIIITPTKKGDDALMMDQLLGETDSKSSKKKEQPSYRSNPANRKKFLRDNPNMTDKDFDKLFKAKGGSVDELGKMLTRNDGGMAMKTRVF
tara:strand:+ start:222 stop:497 length:276 start_codon:yes stop_codon:yes gene_type:complete